MLHTGRKQHGLIEGSTIDGVALPCVDHVCHQLDVTDRQSMLEPMFEPV